MGENRSSRGNLLDLLHAELGFITFTAAEARTQSDEIPSVQVSALNHKANEAWNLELQERINDLKLNKEMYVIKMFIAYFSIEWFGPSLITSNKITVKSHKSRFVDKHAK